MSSCNLKTEQVLLLKNTTMNLIKNHCFIIRSDEYDDEEWIRYNKVTIYGKIPFKNNID